MRVGIVGAGTMGEVHAAAWRNAGAELAGCTSVRRAQSEDLARRYGMIPYADCQELINDVDIVDICTPTEQHKPDDAVLFDLLAAWAPDAATRRRILVSNPEKLYGFAASG